MTKLLYTDDEIKKNLYELEQMDANIAALSKKRVTKMKHKSNIIADIIFFLAVFFIFISVLTINIRNDKTKSFFGYSYFTVISNSMKYEIPKGSLIFVKHTNIQDLKLGDNITFKTYDGTLVTHKIIGIYESGEKISFQTKGTNNTSPDDFIVNEDDIIGKVIQIVPGFGAMMLSINERIPIIFVMLSLLIIVYFLYFKEENTNEKTN